MCDATPPKARVMPKSARAILDGCARERGAKSEVATGIRILSGYRTEAQMSAFRVAARAEGLHHFVARLDCDQQVRLLPFS
jgi:hypothetical protein